MAKLGGIPWNCVCGEEVEIGLSAREGAGTYDVTGRTVINITADTSGVTNHAVSCPEFAEGLTRGATHFELLKDGLDLEEEDEQTETPDNSGNADPDAGPTTFDGGQPNEVEQKLWGDGIKGPEPTPGYGNAPLEDQVKEGNDYIAENYGDDKPLPSYDQGGSLPSGSATVTNTSGEAETVIPLKEQAKASASDDDTSSGS